jgi:hypothetical protein
MTAPPADRSRRTTMILVAGVAVVVAAGAAWYLSRGRAASVPAPPAAPTAAAAAPSSSPASVAGAPELPKPEVGVDARPPTAVPVPTAVPTEAPPTRPPVARKFAVQFSSIPPATLSVDGRVIGPSVPAQRVELEEGTHRYKFEASGLPTYEQTIKVGSNGAPPVNYQFSIGSLVLKTDPTWIGASIIVDGKYKATVSAATERVRLPPGTHRVIVLREGFRPANREITIEKGADLPWSLEPAVPIDGGG